jgi:hypothetical protein
MMGRTGIAMFIREIINAYKILVGNPEGHQLENLGLDGRIILNWNLNKLD